MMFLFDTNIFLEILLSQENASECKEILIQHSGGIAISDFSLHSIGVILFREKREDLFEMFLSDVLPNAELIALSIHSYAKF